MFMKLLAGGITAAMLLSAPAAYAASVFNFGGSNATQSSFSYTVDGIGLTVTGERKDGCILHCYKPEDVSRAAGGLGVKGGIFDSAALDGQIDERMTFSFDQDVKMMSIMFSAYDDNDPYNIYVDSGAGLTLITADAMTNPYTFTPFLVGNTLRIALDGNSSAFRVSGLTVSAVPLPAGGLLLLAGLGGLGALRRRKNKKQS